MFNLDYTPIQDKDGVSEINLKVLFESNYDDLPWLVESHNCIYLITNTYNLKRYVGKSGKFNLRFLGPGFNHRDSLNQGVDTILYRALRKYDLSYFKVEILEIDCEDTSLKESYWIEKLHTCIYDKECWGYNMTWGGEDCSNLRDPAIRKKAALTNKLNHNGILAFNTPESREKALITNALNYNGDCAGQLHTPEAREKAQLTKTKLYGDPAGQLHTKDSLDSSMTTQLINGINKYIKRLKDKDYEVTPQNYYNVYLTGVKDYHIIAVFKRANIIKYDDRFTWEAYYLFKDIYEYFKQHWPEWTLEYLGEINPFE